MNKQSAPNLLTLITFVLLFSACGNQQTSVNSNSKTTNETVSNATSNSNTENSAPTVSSKTNLNVSTEFWQKQMDAAKMERNAPVGEMVQGLTVPPELQAGGVVKQKQKLSEMIAGGYTQPLDFTELADKRLKGELVELPIATESYVLDVGGGADDSEFTSFSFEGGSVALKPDSTKFATLKKLADDFDGQKYDLNNPADRKQIRIRLLSLINPTVKTTLEKIADSYQKKFNRPLRITGLVRSMDYQISLNKVNANSFKVTGKDALPPHLSGCAFDIDRKSLTAEEQNFIMQKLVGMKTSGNIDALIESGATTLFHVFVYFDGKPPKV